MATHDWKIVERYGHGHRDQCLRCGSTRHYSWDPGWPGSHDYFKPDGSRSGPRAEVVPPCVELPSETELRSLVADEDGWSCPAPRLGAV